MEHADPDSLFIFALTVLKSLDPDTSIKSALVHKAVAAAVAKADFFKPKPVPVPNNYWKTPDSSEITDPNLETFKACLKNCLTLHCPQVIACVLDKAKQTTGMSAAHVQDRVKNVMLPLVSFVADLRSRNPSAFPSLAVKDLAQTAITAFLATAGPAGRKITVTDMRSLAKAAFLEGGAELIATR